MQIQRYSLPDFARALVFKSLFLFACCAFPGHSAQAAVIEAWVQRYSNVVSNSDDQAFKLVIDMAGDIIVAGHTEDGTSGRDMFIIKYSGADGAVIWQRRYDGPAHADDEARAVAVDPSGNVVMTGSSYSGANNIDFYTAKYAAADGALLWEKRYNTPTYGSNNPRAIAVDDSSNVIVTGSASAGGGNLNFYTAKYAAADGALLWQQRYNGQVDLSHEAPALAVDGGANVIITGSAYVSGSSTDYYTAKYAAADGALLWEKRYNGPGNLYDSARAVTVDASGNVVVTGHSYYTGGLSGYYTAKYAADDGALLWEQRGPGDLAEAVAVDGSGNVVVTGSAFGYIGANGADYYTAKYAATNGALLWEQRYNGSANGRDYAQALVVDGCGDVIVTGYSFNGTNYDYCTAKYAARDGALLWQQVSDGPANSGDYAQAVAVDGNGNVVVTGFTYVGQGRTDVYTTKYAAVDGSLRWTQRYNGTGNRTDSARALVMDDNGNVAVTGESSNGANSDYYTAKYAALDGALLWEHRYNGPANGNDSAQAIATDGSGNVVVTGFSYGSVNLADYYTAKYAAVNGALLWEHRYNGTGYRTDSPEAIATDDSGNVVVTGRSFNSAGFYDYYTAKYDATNGALLWERRGPGGFAQAVALDGSGNVVVTGDAYSDYYTVKYAANDGAVLWEHRGPRGVAHAVAIDGNGNVVVTGEFRNGTNSTYYTAKYAAANGALLWEKSGPAGIAHAVAVDSGGNPVVTGQSWTRTNYDYYTAKYAAADGALLWGKCHNGSPNGYDSARAVAVDSRDHVVVTGNSIGSEGNTDYYTVKYAASDGALIWEQRYNGPANQDNNVLTSRCLAVSRNGVVAVTGSSDVHLGLGQTYDYATVVYWEHLPPVSLELVPGGVRIRFSGVPGQTYDIQGAPSLTGPWKTISTQIAPGHGTIEYVDTNPRKGSAFYRTRTQ